MIVAVIPARGGSKRILKKNIKPFFGKPIIHYSIEAALESNVFDRVIVSTDSEEIAQVAKQAGAEIPFMRPDKISDDFASTTSVMEHAIEKLNKDSKITYTCCIYATAPFVGAEYIRQGLEIIKQKKVSSVFSVTSFPFPIFRALKKADDGTLSMFWPEHLNTRSNDLPEAYHDAGQFYWLDAEKFLKEPIMYGKDAQPVILPRYLVQDIDTMEDWEVAEKMYKAIF